MPKIRSLVAGTAAVAAVVAVTAAAPSAGAGVPAQTGDAVAATEVLRAIGLTQNGRLVRFNTNNPSRSESIGFVSGLNAGTRLIGIDYRVQDNKLYGVGDDGAVYTIRVRSATATQVSQLTVPLDGTQFGVDFNPAADRLRIVSNTGQNLRHDVNLDVTTVDVTLSYPPDIPVAVGVTAVAYTNNDLDTSTNVTLFDIDTNLDQVAIQSPANSGTLSATGLLGINVQARAGFDIYSELDRNGRTTSLQAFAVLRTADGPFRLYSVSLLQGDVSSRGAFRNRTAVVDLAIPLNQ